MPSTHVDSVDQEYRRHRRSVFAGIFIGYAAYYLVRNNLALAIPDILAEYPQHSKADLGWALTGLSISYGISKFLMGSVSDRANPKYFLPLGLLLLPANHPNRLTSTPRLPHWSVDLGRDYNVHSPISWVDVASSVVELEIKQRLSAAFDFRANLADHYRPRSSFREGGSSFLNAGTVVPLAPVPDTLAPGSPV